MSNERHDDGRTCSFRLGVWAVDRYEDARSQEGPWRDHLCDRDHLTAHAVPVRNRAHSLVGCWCGKAHDREDFL